MFVRIAIVIPAYNAAATLGDTLRSVLAQTFGDWRLVVVDDGSSDSTSETALAVRDSRIRMVHQTNSGVSAARNHGMDAVDGDAFLFLDADDCLAPRALAALGSALAVNPWAATATGAARFATNDGGRGTRRNLPAQGGDLLPRLMVRNRFANCGQLLIRRDVVRAVGGFRSDLSYGEDWEYAIRVAAQGRFAAVPESAPLLIVRERAEGAYQQRVSDASAIAPCLSAIFANPLLLQRFSPARLAALRRRAEAENAWVVGRALLRQGRGSDGRIWLRRAFTAAPSLRRAALLLALSCRSLAAGGCGRAWSEPHASARKPSPR